MSKKFPPIITLAFLLVFLIQLISLLFIASLPGKTQALDSPLKFTPQVEIPGFGEYNFSQNDSTKPIGLYIKAIYKYAIGVVGIIAAVVLMWGGFSWLLAGGNAEKIGEAKAWIGAALTGLFLAIISFAVLATINPNLVDFKITPIQKVENIPDQANNYRAGWYYNWWSLLKPEGNSEGPFKEKSECEEIRNKISVLQAITNDCYYAMQKIGNQGDACGNSGGICQKECTLDKIDWGGTNCISGFTCCTIEKSGFCLLSNNNCVPILNKDGCKDVNGKAYCADSGCPAASCVFIIP